MCPLQYQSSLLSNGASTTWFGSLFHRSVLSIQLCSNKYQFDKSLVWLTQLGSELKTFHMRSLRCTSPTTIVLDSLRNTFYLCVLESCSVWTVSPCNSVKLRLHYGICSTFAWHLQHAFTFTFGKSASPVRGQLHLCVSIPGSIASVNRFSSRVVMCLL